MLIHYDQVAHLYARITELEKALQPFIFQAYPERFQGESAQVSEALVCDADVQYARKVLCHDQP